ncbi:MAG: class I SAM-dependent methyltransferase [Anaerolineales bacterium]|nr:class I SAM-dependent methyltransferase [Anaerolineales bacterium]MDW8448308.1 class I SAM-dependent methyltransferase [Anaerolineales bacterium]
MESSLGPPSDEKAARCGEPSYVWRAGQERRWQMILKAAGGRVGGKVLENGCGIGLYLEKFVPYAQRAIGLEIDWERAYAARRRGLEVLCAAAEHLPFSDQAFDLILSHEVLEHVRNDRQAMEEMTRVLREGGRLVLFVPNRGYPFETHGIYWRGRYHFGNIPLVNYLPRRWRNRLAPHVRVYERRDLEKLIEGLPLRLVSSTVIFGAYDNIIARFPVLGRALRCFLQNLERTPLRLFGLSHFWVLERT